MKHSLSQITMIASIAHAVNAAYCQSLGDDTQVAWGDAPEWQKQSAMAGVEMHLANPDATPEQSHESWLKQKIDDGWKYGEVKDAAKKEHPCFMPYAELPQNQKSKDYLFRAVVHALKDLDDPEQLKAQWQKEAVQQYQKQMSNLIAIKGAAVSQDPSVAAPQGVKYIGRRDEWRDSVYGTGLYFTTGQVRMMPAEIARKLLQHADLFELHVDSVQDASQPVDDTQVLLDESSKDRVDEREEINREMNIKDQIARMEKPALIEYAHNNYKQQMNKRDTVAVMREKVLQFIDQFGVV